MSTGSGGKPDGGTEPGRPAADTPQRIVVRSLDPEKDSKVLGAHDTAVAVAAAPTKPADAPTAMSDTSSSASPGSAAAGQPGARTVELIGVTLSGRHLVTRKVGQGGMGAVYEATHALIGKRVAVKVLLEKYARREAIVQRLEQ